MYDIWIGDEVYSYSRQLFARVEEIFPAAVCVRVAILRIDGHADISVSPHLWRADDIENLSICRYCGAREDLILENETGIPFRVCRRCQTVPPLEQFHDVGTWW
ncbi:MAG: hypothetical protein Fur005_12640 [Roseiflexaceae bacterium]